MARSTAAKSVWHGIQREADSVRAVREEKGTHLGKRKRMVVLRWRHAAGERTQHHGYSLEARGDGGRHEVHREGVGALVGAYHDVRRLQGGAAAGPRAVLLKADVGPERRAEDCAFHEMAPLHLPQLLVHACERLLRREVRPKRLPPLQPDVPCGISSPTVCNSLHDTHPATTKSPVFRLP